MISALTPCVSGAVLGKACFQDGGSCFTSMFSHHQFNVLSQKTHTTTLNIVNNNNNNNYNQFLSTPCSAQLKKTRCFLFFTCFVLIKKNNPPRLERKNGKATKRHFHCYFEDLNLEIRPRTARSLPVALQT